MPTICYRRVTCGSMRVSIVENEPCTHRAAPPLTHLRRGQLTAGLTRPGSCVPRLSCDGCRRSKLRVSPHLVGLADPAEEPLYQRFVAGSEFENCLRRSPELTRNSRQPPWAWSRRACSRRTNSAAFCPGGTRRGATPSSARIEATGSSSRSARE